MSANAFQHTGTLTLPGLSNDEAGQVPYAFGPNQAAILCQLRGWEFWEMEEKVLAGLHAVAAFSQLVAQSQAGEAVAAEEVAAAADAARRGLFNDPVFVQAFYYSAVAFGCELRGHEVPCTAAELGAWWYREPAAFLPVLVHYTTLQAARLGAAAARPTSAPRAGETTTAKKPARKPNR